MKQRQNITQLFAVTKIVCLTLVMVTLILSCGANMNKYEASWESVQQHPDPEWFRDAKLGIYFHWGPYSVPAHKTEWYSHYMYVDGHPINKHHIETYGTLDKFGYKDFIPMFKAEKFDPDAWVDLFVKAGARFAGPVTEHADGFAMWDSELTEWNAAKMGPKRDIVGEMEKAVRKRGLKFITTLHHQWLWAWYPTMNPDVDASNPQYADLYGPPAPVEAFHGAWDNESLQPDSAFNNRWLSRAKEVVDKYQPDLVWFDNKLALIKEETRLEFLSHYYNSADKWGRDVAATYKFEEFKPGAGILDLERARMSEGKEFPWLTDDSIDWGSWCHVDDPDYKSTDRLIDFLVDVVSKNGCVLLNITPRADGTIPQPVQDRLLEMGEWLKQNGEAIYDTRPWKIFGEGPTEVVDGHLKERENADNTAEDIRFTTNGETLYATILDWPGESAVIKSLGKKAALLEKQPTKVQLLGNDSPLSFEMKDEGLRVEFPKEKSGDFAYCLKMTF